MPFDAGFRSYDGNRPPPWPLEINKSSPQSRGLLYCGIMGKDGFVDLVTDKLASIQGSSLTRTIGQYGHQVEADGTDTDEIDLGSTVYLTLAKPFTICWQTKLDAFTDAFPGVCTLLNTEGADVFQVFYSNNANFDDIGWGTGDANTDFDNQHGLMPTGISVTGEWHWGVLSFDGTDPLSSTATKVWINSREVTNESALSYGNKPDVNVLTTMGAATTGWDGPFKQFRIYNWAWPQSMAQAFYLPQTRWDVVVPRATYPFAVPAVEAAAGNPYYAYAQQ